ncbi:ATP-binding protein [Kitasatospora sp. NPDC048722]|uniref:ATP-binding protein n=1 Tax=Kitasatospora sp. NPDC048722 TaxID=3155639 RepID=UPI003407720B
MDVLAHLDLPPNSVIALLGCAGSGKSRVAAMFPPGWVLSADEYRAALSDDPGDQSASGDAWDLLKRRLNARMRRGRPCVVDATHTERWVRVQFVTAARYYGMTPVALRVEAPLDTARSRNTWRLDTRHVPDDVVAEQHAALSALSAEDLRMEGFVHVRTAAELPVLTTVLQRLTEQQDEDRVVETVFGPDLAALFEWDRPSREPRYRTGTVAAGGQEIRLRWIPGEDRFEVRVDCGTPGCTEPVWAAGHGLRELTAAVAGSGGEAFCFRCGQRH